MGKRIQEVDDYIAKAAPFARPILKRLRTLTHKACPKVEERIRWGAPTFDHHGMLGGMAAFKAHVSFGFWRAKELDDPQGLFRDEAASIVNFQRMASLDDVPDEATLLDYIRRAAALNEAGPAKKPARRGKPKPPPEVPEDFRAALRRDPKAIRTFDAFPPGQQREYIDWITEAKRAETRQRRLAQAIEWLAEGNRRNWKYENG